MAIYTGPIVDAHHHMWRSAPGSHPWLADMNRTALCRDFSVTDYATTFAAFPVIGTVWIEALAADPFAELASAETDRMISGGRICSALIGHQPLDAADIGHRLDRMAALSPAFRGIRDIVAASPGQPGFARHADLLDRPAFLAGLRALADRGLVFDLMLMPHQMAAAATLLAAVPDLTVAVEHVASPHDPSGDAMALWIKGLKMLADLPGIIIKVSALQCLDPSWTSASLGRYLDPVTTIFGPDRMCMGTDYPVHDLICPGPVALTTLLHLTEGWGAADQQAFFHDTASRTYRLATQSTHSVPRTTP